MGDQSTPANRKDAQDPARTYERAKPEAEAGMGSLEGLPGATPTPRPDKVQDAVPNRHPDRQVNADDLGDDKARPQSEKPEQPDHSMFDEEPDGWDLAPTDIHNPRYQRHPRTEGKGGTP